MAPRFSTTLKTVKVGGKSYKQPTITQQSFTKAVKKVIHKEAETKSAINHRLADSFNDLVYAQNLNFFIPQGDTAESIEGEKMFLKNIYIKGRYYSYNTASPGASPLFARVMVIRTKDRLLDTYGSITASNVFRGNTGECATSGFPDLHKVDVLYDKLLKVPQTLSGTTGTSVPFTMNIKVNKNHYYEQDNGGYFKDKNYYLIHTCYKADNTATTNGAIRFQWAINFKDM